MNKRNKARTWNVWQVNNDIFDYDSLVLLKKLILEVTSL